MTTYSALTVADSILAKAAKKGQLMSNLKLQKLLYYVQGLHLVKFDSPAFYEQIKAWAHGPVVPAVYHRFKKFSWHEIDEIPDTPVLAKHTDRIVDEVLRRLLGFSGIELEDMTHAETPWQEARAGVSIGEPVGPNIRNSRIKAFFSKKC